MARLFWQHDFEKYTPSDISPVQHKLSKLLTSDTVSLMLSQPDSLFTFDQIMANGQILLLDLSDISTELKKILGSFALSMLHLTALDRDSFNTESQRQFHIYCDEAHRFMTDAMEDMIAETRKFNVSMTFAHQSMAQFAVPEADALSNVGSTIIFRVNKKDAQYLCKELMDKVEVKDLITLKVGQAIARIDNEVVRMNTQPPLNLNRHHCRLKIIDQSRQRYYRPIEEVRQVIHEQSQWPYTSDKSAEPDRIVTKSSDSRSSDPVLSDPENEIFEYDEF